MTLAYKKLCQRCKKYGFFKDQWGGCLLCYEKRFGKYEGKDRDKYVHAMKITV